MPKVKVGAEFKQIPFDPDVIAELIRSGQKVAPDDDISQELWREQNRLVRRSLAIRRDADIQSARKQWGDVPLKPELKRFSLHGKPSLREDDSFGKRLQSPGTANSGTFLNIKPNPFIINMPTIDPNVFMEEKKEPWET